MPLRWSLEGATDRQETAITLVGSSQKLRCALSREEAHPKFPPEPPNSSSHELALTLFCGISKRSIRAVLSRTSFPDHLRLPATQRSRNQHRSLAGRVYILLHCSRTYRTSNSAQPRSGWDGHPGRHSLAQRFRRRHDFSFTVEPLRRSPFLVTLDAPHCFGNLGRYGRGATRAHLPPPDDGRTNRFRRARTARPPALPRNAPALSHLEHRPVGRLHRARRPPRLAKEVLTPTLPSSSEAACV